MKKQDGFTLVQMSMVLVVVGLIVGGVLVAKNLFEATRIHAQIKQFETYEQALNAFELKYNCLPGDCKNAATFGLGDNGNGNGILEMNDITPCLGYITDKNYSSPDCQWNGEFPLFFQHLAAAKLIPGDFDGSFVLNQGYPATAINPGAGMMAAGGWGTSNIGSIPDYLTRDYGFPSANGYWLHLKICDTTATRPGDADEGCAILSPIQMKQIDVKIDDGKPLSGIFWGYTPSYDYGPTTKEGPCLTDDYSDYNADSNILSCFAAYRLLNF